MELDEDNLEAILAVPTAILAAFPSMGKTEQEIAELLEFAKAEGNFKGAFKKLLHPVGGYTKENAAAIAAHIERPHKFVAFFTKVNELDSRT